jgi:hypothetical protein
MRRIMNKKFKAFITRKENLENDLNIGYNEGYKIHRIIFDEYHGIFAVVLRKSVHFNYDVNAIKYIKVFMCGAINIPGMLEKIEETCYEPIEILYDNWHSCYTIITELVA